MDEKRKSQFNENLLLFFTGVARTSSEVAKKQVACTKDKTAQLQQMQAMVREACQILTSQTTDLDKFGELLHETWLLKRSLTDAISNSLIDEIYSVARDNGAIGGKILGAGGGGFILFYVKPENQEKVKQALGNLINVPFKFDDQGCQTVLYAPKHYDPSTYQKLDYIHMQHKDEGVLLKP